MGSITYAAYEGKLRVAQLTVILERFSGLSSDEGFDINILIKELRCVDALIDDIATFVESHRTRDSGLRARKLKARLELLCWILLRAPECVSAVQMEQVCDYVVGDKSLGTLEREMAFGSFALLTV